MRREQVITMYKELLLNIIDALPKQTVGRKSKYTNESFINNIFRIFFYGECWNTFHCVDADRSTVRKRFYKWRDLGVFQKAYEMIYKKYKDKRILGVLYIDSTVVINENCSAEELNYYYKIKTKKQLKISAISDNNNVILSTEISDPKIHDSRFIKPLINNLDVNLKEKTVLVGDKGYIVKKKHYKQNNKNIRLVVPKKSNQRKYMTKSDKVLQQQRFKVEQTFSSLKRTYRRLRTVADRLLINYETFFIMALTCQLLKHS